MTGTSLFAQGTLPRWTVWPSPSQELVVLNVPAQLAVLPDPAVTPKYLALQLDPQWAPDWKDAAFQLKGLIVAFKSQNPQMKVGIEASESQINSVLGHELAAYFDGYIYGDTPFLPEADETGKLWQKMGVAPEAVLSSLVEASSIGVELVLFQALQLSDAQRGLLETVSQTRTGSIDEQPAVSGISQESATFFLDPTSGFYHLALMVPKGEELRVAFELGKGTKVRVLYPASANFKVMQYGPKSELVLQDSQEAYFFEIEPGEKITNNESVEVTRKKLVDPYELVVKNQVFKREQETQFESLAVDEELNYRYAAASGVDIDVTFVDTVIERKGKAIERIRHETYIAGARWQGEKQPELPLISPEKVQTAPLVIDLDKSYDYLYKGEDSIGGARAWKVSFSPKSAGDFYSGTVWIDQTTGAHLRIKAIQSGLEAPVIGNEMDVYFGWVEQDGKRFWTQIRENNLQLVNLVGERINVQISGRRSNYRFNKPETEQTLAQAYQGGGIILRDTQKGFRYLKKNSEGTREVSNETFLKKKAIIGGVFVDPALDTPIPLAGFNYTNLDFMKRGLQANFFVAGAVNDLIISDADFMGKGWDLTGELFVTPLYFGDTVYQNGEERKDLEVESLGESFNVTLGVPLNTFWKVSANYALVYNAYRKADETAENYVLPQDHLEHIGRLDLAYSRGRFSSKFQYELVNRSKWEDFGLPEDSDPVQKQYSKVRLDASYALSLPKFQTFNIEGRYLKGKDLDRFSRFGFGFFQNRVDGFGSSGVRGDEAVRAKVEYGIGIKGLFNVGMDLTAAHAALDEPVNVGGYLQPEKVDLAGVGLNLNFMGPWNTIVRVDMGYGLHSTIDEEAGNVSGQIVFLKLF